MKQSCPMSYPTCERCLWKNLDCSHLWGAALHPFDSHQPVCQPPSPHATSGTAGVSSSITLNTACFEEVLVRNQKEAFNKP